MTKKPVKSVEKKELKKKETKKRELREKTSAERRVLAASKKEKAKKPAKAASTGGIKTASSVRAKKKPERASAAKKTQSAASTGKSPANMHRDDLLKKQLIWKREEIVREAKSEIAKYIKGETRQLVESVLDDGDWSVVDLSEDINLRRLAAHREVLLKIDEALRKIREGTYGICEECGEAINTARLKVLPFAIYCRDCQEKKEEIEKVESEEI